MKREIAFRFARLVIGEGWACTRFEDGTEYGAYAHDTPAYRVLAARCGYGDDIDAYMAEHEAAHSYVAQELYGGPSRVIWPLAHGGMADKLDILHEEELAISLQAFARARILPGSSAPGFSWFRLRDGFLSLMEG